MDYKLKISEPAYEDFDAILTYIAHELCVPEAAARFANAVEEQMRVRNTFIIILVSLLIMVSCAGNLPDELTIEPGVITNESTGQAITPIDNQPEFKFLELSSLSYLEYTIINDNVTITAYVGEDKDVVIPAEIAGKSVTNIGESAFANCSSLSSIVLPENLTSIGGAAFSNCSNLNSVLIPDNVTSIEVAAFMGCSSLKSITIPGGVEYVGRFTFALCVNLELVEFLDGVLCIGDDAFDSCRSLSSVTIPASLESIYPAAFYLCLNLISINIAEDNPVYASKNGVLFNKDMTELINYPYGKKGVYTIPSTVTTINDWAFAGCSGLTTLTIPDSVINIGYEVFGAVVNPAG